MKRGKNEFYNLESNRAWSVSAGKTFPSYKLLTGFADLAPKKVDTRPGKKLCFLVRKFERADENLAVRGVLLHCCQGPRSVVGVCPITALAFHDSSRVACTSHKKRLMFIKKL
jgi:hypothetical protein